MSRTRLRQRRSLGALAVFQASLIFALSGAARAQPEDDQTNPTPAETPAPAAPRTTATMATTATSTPDVPAVAPPSAAPPPLWEEMGPNTFPGRLRGLYGGSLWLEPSFDGLQWPHNSRTGIGISGMVSLEGGYETIKRDQPTLLNSTINFQQSRGVLRVTPAYVRDDFFIQGQVELVGNACQAAAPNAQTSGVCAVSGTFTTDDLWIKVGHWNVWDLQVGRFQAWQVYHLGMGLGLGIDPFSLERLGAGMFGQTGNTGMGPALEVPYLYSVNYMHDRPAEGLAVGHAALHVYATDYLRFELLGKWGSDNYQDNSATGGKPFNYRGARPTAILDLGWFKLKVGAEYEKATPVLQTIGGNPGQPQAKTDSVEQLIREGVGGSMQFIIDPIVEFGVNGAVGRQRYTDASGNGFGSADTLAKSYTTKSVGGFATVRLAAAWLLGVGVNWTDQLDKYTAPGSSVNDYVSQLQGFASLQYLLAGQLYIKGEFDYAKATFQPSDFVPSWNNYMYNGNLRLMYLF
jgi:hypothetical protein